MRGLHFLRRLPLRFRRYIIYERPVLWDREPADAGPVTSFRQLSALDLPEFGGLVAAEALPGFEQRFAEGELCFGGFDREKMVAFNWVSLKKAFDDRNQIEIALKPGQAYSYHFLVDSAYRNLGVGTALGLYKDSTLSALGYDGLVSIVDFRNHASRRMNIKLGNRAVEMIYLLEIVGRRLKCKRRLPGLFNRRIEANLTDG